MPITLAQSKVGLADKVDQAVVDEFRRSSLLLDKLIFDNAVSPGTGGSTLMYGYVRLKTPSTAAGRAINSEYTPGEAIKEKATTELKIMGGSFEVDRVLEDTAAQSEIAFQLSEKTKATANEFHYQVINGDSTADATQFDGLDKLLTNTASEYIPAGGIDLSTEEMMEKNKNKFADMMATFTKKLNGKPDFYLMNGDMKLKAESIARRLGYYTRSKDAFGEDVDCYKNVPMLDMEKYFDGNNTLDVIPVDSTDGTTDIYAIKIGLKDVHGVSPTGKKLIKAYLPNKNDPGAVKKGEVEFVGGIAVKNTRSAAVFRGIKINAAAE